MTRRCRSWFVVYDTGEGQIVTGDMTVFVASFNMKRFIGRRFSDPVVQDDIKHISVEVARGDGKKPLRHAELMMETKQFELEEVSSIVSMKMCDPAQVFVSNDVKNAAVTRVMCFNDLHRHPTNDAGLIVWPNVMRKINDPTEVIAYDHHKGSHGMRDIMIADLGWTFDVSPLTVDSTVFEVEATSGDAHLGRRTLAGW